MENIMKFESYEAYIQWYNSLTYEQQLAVERKTKQQNNFSKCKPTPKVKFISKQNSICNNE